jgi:hypothetical protein
LALLIGGLSLAATATAEEAAPTLDAYLNDPFTMVRDFARCSAFSDHLAEFMDQQGKPATAEQLRGTARGEKVVGQIGATIFPSIAKGDSEPEGEELVKSMQSNVANFDAYYEIERNRQSAILEGGELDTELMMFCAAQNPIQTQLIEEMRRSGLFASPTE